MILVRKCNTVCVNVINLLNRNTRIADSTLDAMTNRAAGQAAAFLRRLRF